MKYILRRLALVIGVILGFIFIPYSLGLFVATFITHETLIFSHVWLGGIGVTIVLGFVIAVTHRVIFFIITGD